MSTNPDYRIEPAPEGPKPEPPPPPPPEEARSKTMSNKNCGNCCWLGSGKYHETSECYYYPPGSYKSQRPVVQEHDKACSNWRGRDDEET